MALGVVWGTPDGVDNGGKLAYHEFALPSGQIVDDGLRASITARGGSIRPPLVGRLNKVYFNTINVFAVPELCTPPAECGIDTAEKEALLGFLNDGGVVILGLFGRHVEKEWLEAFPGFGQLSLTGRAERPKVFEVNSTVHELVTNVNHLFSLVVPFNASGEAVSLATDPSGETVAAVLEDSFPGAYGVV